MAEKLNRVRIEDTLMKELRFGGIDKENLKELVAIVAGIQKKGLKRFRVFTKGLPPIVDGLRVSGVLDASEISGFFSEVLTKTPRLDGIFLFPLGTPWPDFFRVNIDIGSSTETDFRSQF